MQQGARRHYLDVMLDLPKVLIVLIDFNVAKSHEVQTQLLSMFAVTELFQQGIFRQERKENKNWFSIRCGTRHSQYTVQCLSTKLTADADWTSAEWRQHPERVTLLRSVSSNYSIFLMSFSKQMFRSYFKWNRCRSVLSKCSKYANKLLFLLNFFSYISFVNSILDQC